MKISHIGNISFISLLSGLFLILCVSFVYAQTTLQAVPATTDPEPSTIQATPIADDAEETADKDHEGEIDVLSTSATDDSGDPDQPVITGNINDEGPQYNETDLEFLGERASDSDSEKGMNKPDLVESLSSKPSGDTKKESGEKGGTEDINIGVGELQESGGIEHEDIGAPLDTMSPDVFFDITVITDAHDPGITLLENLASKGIDNEDIGFISNGQTYVRSGYLKIGDIKGESTDTEKKGRVEYTWKVEEGEKARKPKEIVVVGSKNTDASSPSLQLKNCDGTQFVCESKDVHTADDLEEYLARQVNEGGANEIRLDDSKMEIKSTQAFRLFGFLPLQIPQTTTINMEGDEFGRVKVHFPWWHALGRKTVRPSDFVLSLEEAIESADISGWEPFRDEIDGSDKDPQVLPVEEITFNFEEVRAAVADTAMSIIRKIG